ncbi:MAG: 30S ribosome-binding factor RbfA [Defluviitaleaceae bacterium]|nr:30S ribosome-binding factor RbfA [Defluviitaleaceae bacterium]
MSKNKSHGKSQNNQRIARINDEIARTAADIIRFEMSDPRIGTVVSVVGANTTTDLKFCKISVSVLEGNGQKNVPPEETLEALANASGFIRKRIAETLNLRHTPEITFLLDDSIASAMRMHKLIDEVVRNDS